ncbi:MAG: hypothetical protein AABZ60_05785 [Planctomycetota bacterium]
MRVLILFGCCFFLFSCFGAIDDLKGTVPDMIMYSIEYDVEPLMEKQPPAAPSSLAVKIFGVDAEYTSNLIRVYAPEKNSAAITSYPENERWIGLPAYMLTEKIWSQFIRKYSNVYLAPAPFPTDYEIMGQLKHFEEIRTASGSKAFVEIVFYFNPKESGPILGPFTRQASEPFQTNPDVAVNMVQAMKKACTNVCEQIIQDFEREVSKKK